ncbi:uncharacterized protein LOC113851562 [Abrus precatorius]|uniref:Uncharacterized protein LOC113851562 n=1 Tax=Abrus precatorius TaxID=3816 RepID=A0A8B8K3E7_ABRPR|nr:uncharacterized protein LOC113851562 [Abrus precatorius]
MSNKTSRMPYLRGYDPNAKCEYHAGGIGDSTENCRTLKFKVQDLINAKWLNFKEDNPNFRINPLLGHGGPSVNAIKEESTSVLKRKVEEVTTPLKVIFTELYKTDLIKSFVHEESMCNLHLDVDHSIEDCEEFKHVLQTLMDKHLVQIRHPKEKNEVLTIDGQSSAFLKPLVIHYTKCMNTPDTNGPRPITIQIPAPFSYKDNKAVPWKYNAGVYVRNLKENQTQGVSSDTLAISNIVGVGGMTRSGRIYTFEDLRKERVKEIEKFSKGKAKLGEFEDADKEKMPKIKKTVSNEEACEFLKFIWRTLLKVLNEAHVNHDITTDKFRGIVGNIISNNYLTFTDDEVPVEGMRHNKALHISVKCQDHSIARVLIDNGSSFYVMSKATLLKLACDESHMKPNAMIVRAFDGTRREVIGEIEIPIQIGPCTFQILFQVMDIAPAYNCLLERPWIHSVGVVPSTLHQTLKFIIDNKLVIVSSEEDMLVSKPSSTPYIEATEEALETSFQALEIVNVTYVGEGTTIADKKRVIEEKKERRSARLEGREPESEGVPICDLLKSFYSAGFEFQDSVTAADEDVPGEEIVNLVHTCPLNTKVGNWEIIELPVIFNDYSNDVFAWSYQDMLFLDVDIIEHKLPLKPECFPVKQKLRRMGLEMSLKIREEVKKQFDAGFLVVAKYPQWVANIVSVPKKDGKVRMCCKSIRMI